MSTLEVHSHKLFMGYHIFLHFLVCQTCKYHANVIQKESMQNCQPSRSDSEMIYYLYFNVSYLSQLKLGIHVHICVCVCLYGKYQNTKINRQGILIYGYVCIYA